MKIAVFNVNWLGDVLFSAPAIRRIRQAWPQAFIVGIVVPRCRDLLAHNPDINEVIVYDEKGRHRSLWGKLRFLGLLRKKRFDKGFLFHRSWTRALIFFLAGIKERIGYGDKRRGALLTTAIAAPDKARMHRAEYYLSIVSAYLGRKGKAAGGGLDNFRWDFIVSDEDRVYIHNLLAAVGINKDDFLVLLNPGGNWRQKRWPRERFVSLARRLGDRRGVRVVISGAEKDVGLGQEIAASAGSKDVSSLCGKTTLGQLAALMQGADVVVSADSGPLHLAIAAGAKRVIALFGPTLPSITGPYCPPGQVSVLRKDTGCTIPCYKQDCGDIRCMRAISVDDVLGLVRDEGKT